jgi:sugar lactone lactonase YvrE
MARNVETGLLSFDVPFESGTTEGEHPRMTGPHTLMTGLVFGESPRWHDNRLWCIDMGAQEVLTVDLEGKSEVIARDPMGVSAIDFLPDGRLLIAQQRGTHLLRMEPDGSLVTHADLGGVSDKPWADMVVDGRGNAYIGNIGFDFPAGEVRPGFVALVTPDGSARQVADGLAFPNGMLVTPDGSTLIVAESYGNRLTAFDIAPDGSLSNRRLWADLHGDFPDGICLDTEHAVWYADVPNKHCVRVREGGEVLQIIDLDRGCFACMLGGADRRTLFLVAATFEGAASWGPDAARTGQVLTIDAPAPGVGWP